MSGSGALESPVLAPLFMPTPEWVPVIDRSGAKPFRTLVEDANAGFIGDLPCTERLVVLKRDESLAAGELGQLLCEPCPGGAVLITVSASLSGVDAARQSLAVLAYALFDPAARRLVRGQPWTRLAAGGASAMK